MRPKRSPEVKEGSRFGKLTVIKCLGKRGKDTEWLCKCDCGHEKITTQNYLLYAKRRLSCGCIRKGEGWQEKNKQEEANNVLRKKLTEVWKDFVAENKPDVCTQWIKYKARFIEWAIRAGYKEDRILVRINEKKPYSPSNSLWRNKDDPPIAKETHAKGRCSCPKCHARKTIFIQIDGKVINVNENIDDVLPIAKDPRKSNEVDLFCENCRYIDKMNKFSWKENSA